MTCRRGFSLPSSWRKPGSILSLFLALILDSNRNNKIDSGFRRNDGHMRGGEGAQA
jgi:hypothetical protein